MAERSLARLKLRWEAYVSHEKSKKEEMGKLVRAAHWLIEPIHWDRSCTYVSQSIDQIHTDWSFLNMFMDFTEKDRFPNVGILPELSERRREIYTLSGKIGEVFDDYGSRDEFFKRSEKGLGPGKLLALIRHWQRKTDKIFPKDFGGVLRHLSDVRIQPMYLVYHSYSVRLLEHTIRNLVYIKDVVEVCLSKEVSDLLVELRLIENYSEDLAKYYDEDDAFSKHVASVVLKIAHQAFDFWINRKDTEIAKVKATELVLLHRQISPKNPEIMALFLRFQLSVYGSAMNDERRTKVVLDFCNYILTRADHSLNSSEERDLREELISLVPIYFQSSLQVHFDRQDRSCLLAEISLMLGKVVFLHREFCQENINDHLKTCSKFLHKLRLLKIELLIKNHLSKSVIMVLEAPFSIVDNIVMEVGRFVQDMFLQKDTEFGRRFFMLGEELNGVVESFRGSVPAESKKITHFLVMHSLQQILDKIVFFKAETVLAELLKKIDSNYSLIACEYDLIKGLVEELADCKRLATSQLMWNSPEEEMMFVQVEEVARRITLISYSILPDSDNDKFLPLVQLSDKVKHIKTMAKEITLPFVLSNFPKICRVGFTGFLCRNIDDLLKYDPVSITPVKYQLKQVQLHLEPLKFFLEKISSNSKVVRGDSNDIVNRIRDIAHQVEYATESVEIDSRSTYSLLLHNLLEEIAGLNQQVSGFPEVSYVVEVKNHPRVSNELLSKDTTSAVNDKMLDLVLADEEEVIINRLTRGSSVRDVVSIVGMPGIGKTTLAQRVYNSREVVFYFHHRAWCTVSLVYSKRELLLDILSDIQGITDEIHLMSDDDLQSKLRRCLLRNRYLIILDDVWDIAAWNDLEISFPDDRKGSRILITSRLQDVPLQIKPGSDPHHIRFLSDEESWVLLKKKVFGGGDFPRKLLLVGKKIAQHCQGLPLAVVAIAGVLQKTERTRDSWEIVSESLSSLVINDPENRCREILELSFKHLPEYLKPCFLYLGVFLRDKDIPVSKLMLLWMAEGFIQETESESLEDVAEDYMFELINRSLVIPSVTRSNGKVKACRLHDLLRDLCHVKAKDENFLRLVTRYDEPYASIPPSVYGMQFHSHHKLDPVTFQSYRLSIYLRRNHFIDSSPSGPITRSLIFFASVDKEPRCPYDISSICTNFKLLRVLDLECINLGVSLPVEIGGMIHLRYLAVSGYMQSIPPSISNLRKLETLVVKGLRGTIMLPITIWSMARLRHLHVNEHVSFSLPDDEDHVESSFCLDNVVSFSTPSLSSLDDTIKILKRFPNLLKMKCIFFESWDSKSFNQFPGLDFFTRLESLKILFYGGTINSGDFVLPVSLKELTLSNFRLPWKHLSRIGTLPNLRVLKLLSGAFEGTKWEMNEEEFQRLEFLKLEALGISEWDASYDHLPYLKRLVVQNCKDLEVIPQDFAYITTLEMIQVQWCGESVEESARRIGDETKEIKVVIARN